MIESVTSIIGGIFIDVVGFYFTFSIVSIFMVLTFAFLRDSKKRWFKFSFNKGIL